jgi:hypothetical protein
MTLNSLISIMKSSPSFKYKFILLKALLSKVVETSRMELYEEK